MRLRQIALVAAELSMVEEALCDVLGLEVCYRDPAVGRWGLVNALMPLGGSFLEVVAPVAPDTSAGRYLARRGGDGGYMVILQCADAPAWRRRLEAMGVRAVATADRAEYRYTHFHPADTGGILLSIDSVAADADWRAEDCPWPPAGPGWTGDRGWGAGALLAAELQSPDPAAMAALWSRLLDRPAVPRPEGGSEIRLENAALRFVAAKDGRGRGLGAIDLALPDPARAVRAARARGLPAQDGLVEVGGLRLILHQAPARTGGA